jgi:general secretion pathway protein K
MTSSSKEKGGALLAVLWMSAALAAIAFSVSTTVRGEIDRVASDTDGLRAHYLATGSVERAIQWMLWGGDYRNPDGSPKFWEFNQPRLYFRFPSGDAVVEMIPEAARLNINTATPDNLVRVIQTVGGPQVAAQEIAQAIVEWRSGANSLDSFYLSLAPTFRPPHASFQEIEELLSVRGMTPELFYGNFVTDDQGRLYAKGGLRDCLSIRGASVGPFDANSASPALMEAMGVPAGDAERVVELRKARPFRNLGELRAAGIGASQLTVGGNVIWTLRATSRLRRPNGTPSEVVRSASALVKLLNREQYFQMPLHVLRYYDDAWSEFAIAPPAVSPLGAIAQGAR